MGSVLFAAATRVRAMPGRSTGQGSARFCAVDHDVDRDERDHGQDVASRGSGVREETQPGGAAAKRRPGGWTLNVECVRTL